jgi:ubiquinone/menaquinone biosynthesis C-methylase UbiE
MVPLRPGPDDALLVTDDSARAQGGTGEEMGSRYDRMAEGYARCWAPVLRSSAEAVLDQLVGSPGPPAETGAPARLLDIGTGTGTLGLAALERWPAIRVSAIDASAAMLEVAERNASRRLAPERRARYATTRASADELPFEDGSFDLAVSSFVLQLVPNRAAVLREVHRVLRPGGKFAWVTWLRADVEYAPDRIANEVLGTFGFEPPVADGRAGDVASPRAAALAMRRAGFRTVRAESAMLEHCWDRAAYVAFLTEFDEEALFSDLEPDERARIIDALLGRLASLAPDELALRLPVVYVTGCVPG